MQNYRPNSSNCVKSTNNKDGSKPNGSKETNTLPTAKSMWIIHVCPTTGGQLNLPVYPEETIENLKKYLSGKLKIAKERMSLLYKDR